ncbi:SMP-30/gluconolactonase/LRE family protein [Pedobacter sp.]
MDDIAILLADGLKFPEGPSFAPDGSLWAVELLGESLLRLKNGRVDRFLVGGKPNGTVINGDNEIWFCDAGRNEIRCLYPNTGLTVTLVSQVQGEDLNQPNDLAFDRQGSLVFTCPGNSRTEPTGYVCVYQRDGLVRKVAEGKYFPNGLAFDAMGDRLIVAETYRHRLWKGDWDPEGCTWSNTQIFSETGGPTGPDGMAFDGGGNLYVAVYGLGKIKVIDTEGRIVDEIIVPGNNPTNCAFDPTGELGLVVTEAEHGRLWAFKDRKF